jgi:hypothetical protein
MKKNIIKNHKNYSAFLGLTALGAIWLTILYHRSAEGFSDPFIVSIVYYIINCALLCFMFIFLRLKYFMLYSCTSLVLLISVVGSMFITSALDDLSIFVSTVLTGMFFGFEVGGTILVPMFLLATFISGIRSIQYIFLRNITYPNDNSAQLSTTKTYKTQITY